MLIVKCSEEIFREKHFIPLLDICEDMKLKQGQALLTKSLKEEIIKKPKD